MIQNVVLILTVSLMTVVIAVFIFVALNAGRDAGDYAPVQEKAYRLRARFFWLLLVAGVLITVVTTLDLPYAATRGELADTGRQIEVEGRQWYWQLSDQKARQGETVVFNVTTSDVNHGFGIYDPDMRLVGQTQAMPGYANSLKFRFEKPGTYKLLCMEYCGLAHHAMISEFNVGSQ